MTTPFEQSRTSIDLELSRLTYTELCDLVDQVERLARATTSTIGRPLLSVVHAELARRWDLDVVVAALDDRQLHSTLACSAELGQYGATKFWARVTAALATHAVARADVAQEVLDLEYGPPDRRDGE